MHTEMVPKYYQSPINGLDFYVHVVTVKDPRSQKSPAEARSQHASGRISAVLSRC